MPKKVIKLEEKVHKILVVDDERDVLDALALTLENAELFKSKVTTVENCEGALKKLNEEEFDLILSDFKMPDMNGVELLNKILENYPNKVRMLITGYSDVNTAKEAINKAKVHNYIEKPWDNDELVSTIYEALKRKNERENYRVIGVNKVQEALKMVNDFYKDPINFQLRENMPDEKLIFEFDSVTEFNRFSFEIKKYKNVYIQDVNVFENKYIITVGITPKSFDEILMYKDCSD